MPEFGAGEFGPGCRLLQEQLHRAFWQEWPSECCGAVFRHPNGSWTFQPLRNVTEGDPLSSFEADPLQVLRICRKADRSGGRVGAWIHSHPRQNGACSVADLSAFWARKQWLWPEMSQGILHLNAQEQVCLALYGPSTDPQSPQPSWQGPLTHLTG